MSSKICKRIEDLLNRTHGELVDSVEFDDVVWVDIRVIDKLGYFDHITQGNLDLGEIEAIDEIFVESRRRP